MNENGPQQAAQLPSPPMNAMLTCVKCQESFVVRIPPARIVNMPDMTFIAYSHPVFEKCPKCGSKYVFQIRGINEQSQLMYSWILREIDKSAIAQGTDENLKHALSIADLSKQVKQ